MNDSFDVYDDYGFFLFVIVICCLFGVLDDDIDWFKEWFDVVVEVMGVEDLIFW